MPEILKPGPDVLSLGVSLTQGVARLPDTAREDAPHGRPKAVQNSKHGHDSNDWAVQRWDETIHWR